MNAGIMIPKIMEVFMGNLFVVYGDVLSERLLFLADILAVSAYGGLMAPQDELTHRLFDSVNGLHLQKAIEDKYGDERMKHGEVRTISGFDFIETLLFVNALDEPLWSLERDPEIEKRLIVGYHNAVTVAVLMGYKSILLPYFGMSLSDNENEYMIKRITRMLLKELSERRRGMDINFVLPGWMG